MHFSSQSNSEESFFSMILYSISKIFITSTSNTLKDSYDWKMNNITTTFLIDENSHEYADFN